MKHPIFSLFLMATLWVWALPLVLLAVFVLLAVSSKILLLQLLGAAVGIILVGFSIALILPWFFVTYFTCVALMFKGRSESAIDRFNHLERLLAGNQT